MASPYRSPDAAPEAVELVYVLDTNERHVAAGRRAIQVGIVGLLATALASLALAPMVALGVFAATILLVIFAWWRAPDAPGLRFRVAGSELEVVARRSNSVLIRTPLQQLHDVRLDTKSIRKVELGGRNAVPSLEFMESNVGPELDVARITLEVEGRSPLPLTDIFLPHMTAIDGVGKIRSFLRGAGWVPADERLRVSEDEDLEDSAEEDASAGDGDVDTIAAGPAARQPEGRSVTVSDRGDPPNDAARETASSSARTKGR